MNNNTTIEELEDENNKLKARSVAQSDLSRYRKLGTYLTSVQETTREKK